MITDSFKYPTFMYNGKKIMCQISRWNDTLRIITEYKETFVEADCSYKKYKDNMNIIEPIVIKELEIIDKKGKKYYEQYKLIDKVK
ncbi:hypothetical protein [Clostridium tyrobutyricum]|uniref:hypothetical protein n=1 Tax=Clostridium tyrobutyricum TaxID=1519 RepID=UPI0002E91DCD|nr:hypothetical protein [Clostridium tyrobutyricum]MBR9649093.1 hypothetical protein [Clostridium tyrobutyricum]MBV4421841.1 hypothetical protein [Clostridium tyrobutyricum]MEA5008602.1 hypothetical protein [Clostridium tyrobutyricum]